MQYHLVYEYIRVHTPYGVSIGFVYRMSNLFVVPFAKVFKGSTAAAAVAGKLCNGNINNIKVMPNNSSCNSPRIRICVCV